ncbi:Xaa-Pro dipeptidase [Sesamum angolense]|uniref:Xaa-Pro dipeptidase n=1 Tax=Sesamum angolense TaxID=2727404 RepID=A0AAE1WNS1_9LAMI|nr:Xaa-Pro dipeptidase [Sesamum angolense]
MNEELHHGPNTPLNHSKHFELLYQDTEAIRSSFTPTRLQNQPHVLPSVQSKKVQKDSLSSHIGPDNYHELTVLNIESYFAYLFGVREPGFYGAIERYMVDSVHYTDEIAKVLHQTYQGPGKPLLYLLHGLNTDSNNFSKPADFEGIDKFTTDLNALHPVLTECRVIKSGLELALIQYANDISSEAHVEMEQDTPPTVDDNIKS